MSNGTANNLNLSVTLNRTSTDNQLYPRRGSEFMVSLTMTPPWSKWDGKDYEHLATNAQSATYQQEQQEKYKWVEYYKWKFKARTFTALTNSTKSLVLMTRVELGLLGSYNRFKQSPFETFYVGGDGMSGYSTGYAEETIGLRGYENGSISNNAQAQVNFSATTPMLTIASLWSSVIRSSWAIPRSTDSDSSRRATPGHRPRTSTRLT